MKQAVHACKRKGLFSSYTAALKACVKLLKEYKKAVENLKTAQENNGSAALIKSLEEDCNTLLNAVTECKGERIDAAEGFFSLYANLLMVEVRVAWDMILSRQIKVTPWTTLKGKPRLRSTRK